jgi:hypothetical protein
VLVSPGNATLNANVSVAADPVLVPNGAAATIALDTPSQSARFAFDAGATQTIGVGVSNTTLAPTTTTNVTYRAYLPDGILLSAPSMPACRSVTAGYPQTTCAGQLTTTVGGTYTIVATPPAGFQMGATVQVSNLVTGTLVPDAQQDVTLGQVGQDARYTFTATAGDSLAVDMSGITSLPQVQYFSAIVSRPDGSTLIGRSAMAPGGAYCELGAVPVTGTYTVGVDPDFGAYGSFKLTLKQGAMLQESGSPSAFAAVGTAETMRFRFSATAGQNYTIGLTGLAYTGTSSSNSLLKVNRPDGLLVGSSVNCIPTVAGGSCKITLTNLPLTGTYSVVISPPAGVKIAGAATLSADVTGTLAAGVAQAINATRAGQNARFTFTGTAGDSTSLKLLGLSTAPAGLAVIAVVYRPDGSYLAQTSSIGAPAILNLPSLPVSGIYTVMVEPAHGVTWQAQIMLDAGTLMAIDGTTASLASAIAGEQLRYRFAGNAGQRVDFGLAGLTYAAASSNSTIMSVYRPDGVWFTGNSSCGTAGAGTCETSIASLPSTGTYSVVFAPPAASTIAGGTFAISTPLAGTLVAGASVQAIAITRPGQTARYVFSGTAGQLLRLNWSGTTVSGGSSVSVTVLKPDAATLSSGSFIAGATGGFDIASLPSTGTYTVLFDPTSAGTMTAPVTLVAR